ncbi:type VII secretion protein EccE [Micromonospora sp. NBC_01796]|uniref:type VII secretion protein EccE n=1 Tax=Micromonospora sp. NBC_01796 TaxID=2975987 RepID=UPI002DD89F8A|nr:type VII secretion protein EccE [Micromonospora sp. NBC_01796]WSA85060.1 type VII secretion protein EccE [Micromonospora sp. NBC_01796]
MSASPQTQPPGTREPRAGFPQRTATGVPVGGGTPSSPDTPERSEPAFLLPRRRPGRLGPLHVSQLLIAEAVVIAILAAFTGGVLPAVVGGVVGAGLLLLALGRDRGRWWLEKRLMMWRYRRRQRDTAGVPAADDPRLAALRVLAPGLTVENVTVAGGTPVGVARDDAGWYAVAEVTPKAPARGEPGGLPVELLVSALADTEQPGAVLQVVTQTVPAPTVALSPASKARQSYQELLGRFGDVPANQETWIAVRLDARAVAEAGASGGSELDAAPAVVATLVHRVAKSLRWVGIPHRLLDAEELLVVLTHACDLEPGHSAEPVQPREDWAQWHSSRLAHRSFWIRGWPALGEAAALLTQVSTAAAAMTSVSLILAPDDNARTVDLRALIRIAAPANELASVSQALIRGAERAGADLFPLDGEQGPAVYASAPTGGGAR